MKLITKYATKNQCYVNADKITVQHLILHSVGCNQPSATVFFNQWNKPTAGVIPHAVIDGNTGEIIQCLPWTYRAWHVGARGNGTCIGVEMCEPSEIKYTWADRFTVSNLAAAQNIAKITYNAAVELFAMLCKKYGLNPLKNGAIMSHGEAYKQGFATNHSDPVHLWEQLKLPYSMDGFRRDVNAALNPVKTIYRVQVGAFSEKTNAEKLQQELKTLGYNTFIVKS